MTPKNARYLCCILMLTVIVTNYYSQVSYNINNINKAEEAINNSNYESALDELLPILESDPKNPHINYDIAVCYLNTNINKTKAIPYLEIASRSTHADPNTLYLLARAYHFAYRFDEAIKCYTQFKTNRKGNAENLKDVDHQIQDCINGKELIKFPVNCTFENLGATINSIFDDYYPFVPKNESYLVYNSKRPRVGFEAKLDGSFPVFIYFSKVVNGVFTKPQVIGPPATHKDGSDEVIGLSPDGSKMLLYYFKGEAGDISIADYNDSSGFLKGQPLSNRINSSQHEIAASITTDGNTIYFASDRDGGIGGVDLYVSRKLPDGTWGVAENLGPEINTSLDEDFPNISPDGKTLYFSSKGHASMGGYDIFKADWDEQHHTWGAVKNLGYPINTPDDNMNLRISENGRYAYISALREGGFGGLDIYRVTFTDVDPEFSVIKGSIRTNVSVDSLQWSNVIITITNTKNQEIYGNYIPNSITGNYIMILPPGKYHMQVDLDGYKTHSENIEILDKTSFKTEITKDILLYRKKD